MGIDVHTLYNLSAAISALLGLLLIFSWRYGRSVPALGLWGAGMVLVGIGLALIASRGSIHNILSIVVANALITLGAAVAWSGTRIFDGKRIPRPLIVAGPLIWIAACAVPSFYASINARAILVFSIIAAYTLAAAFELWRGRALPLLTRWPAIVLLTIQGVILLTRIGLVVAVPLNEDLPGATSGWFRIALYEAILYEIALSFSFLAMAKERAGQRLVIAGVSTKR